MFQIGGPLCLYRPLVFLFVSLASCALAYPPAPPVLVHGMARDPYGWAYRAKDQVVVRLLRDGEILSEAVANDGIRLGENFRALLPVSTDPDEPPYTPQAVRPGDVLSFEVVVNGTVLPVFGIEETDRVVLGPATSLYVDFSTGYDTDGDGLSDDWEFWQLNAANIGPTDPRYGLDAFGAGDFDGDGVSDRLEYLAGTFAGLASDTFRLVPLGMTEDGWFQCQFLAVVDKTYEMMASDDLEHWLARAGAFQGDRENLQTFFYARETEIVTVEFPVGDADLAANFFQLKLR